MTEVMQKYYANPSSTHRLGLLSQQLITRARTAAAHLLRVHPTELIFTSGGSESNNLAIKGAAHFYRSRGAHLITSQIEHPSVEQCFKNLEKTGCQVTYLPVNSTGHIDVQQLRSNIREDTILVSLMHVNNETGSIQPIQEAGNLLQEYPKIIFHVDAIQSAGKIRLDPIASHIDLLSISAHKFQGPKGSGLLYCRKGLRLEPQITGGGQEGGFRSGTENASAIVGLVKAMRLALETQEQSAAVMYRLRNILIQGLSAMPLVTINGSEDSTLMAPHIVNLSLIGMKSEAVVHALEEFDIYVSTKSACASGENTPSKVLSAMGMDHNRASSGMRISISAAQLEQDMHYFLDKFSHVLSKQIKIGVL